MDPRDVSNFFALALLLGAVGVIVAAVRPSTRSELSRGAPAIVAVAAIGATAGSLYFSEIADYIPCTYCWYQRIAMYPMALIVPVAMVLRDRSILRYSLDTRARRPRDLDLPHPTPAVSRPEFELVRTDESLHGEVGRSVRVHDHPADGRHDVRDHRRRQHHRSAHAASRRRRHRRRRAQRADIDRIESGCPDLSSPRRDPDEGDT